MPAALLNPILLVTSPGLDTFCLGGENPVSSGFSSCLLSLLQSHVILQLFRPRGPAALLLSTHCSSPQQRLNSGLHPGLQPCLAPRRRIRTQPPHSAPSPSGSALLPQCLTFAEGMLPGTWAKSVEVLLPSLRTSGHILESSGTCRSPSSCLHLFPPGPTQPQNHSLNCSLVAILTVPSHGDMCHSGKANLRCTLISDHPGTPCSLGCDLPSLASAHCPASSFTPAPPQEWNYLRVLGPGSQPQSKLEAPACLLETFRDFKGAESDGM